MSTYEYYDGNSSDEEDTVAPRELVQIVSPFKDVECWISSFIEENRKQVNLHNVQDFCVAPELRQNCARVDAVLVKRKGTTSHITVKDIKNYSGPQDQIVNSSFSSQSDKIQPNKKIFTCGDIEQKIESLKSQNMFHDRSASSIGPDYYYY